MELSLSPTAIVQNSKQLILAGKKWDINPWGIKEDEVFPAPSSLHYSASWEHNDAKTMLQGSATPFSGGLWSPLSSIHGNISIALKVFRVRPYIFVSFQTQMETVPVTKCSVFALLPYNYSILLWPQ